MLRFVNMLSQSHSDDLYSLWCEGRSAMFVHQAIWKVQGRCYSMCRNMLPKAREQHASSMGSEAGQQMQLPTALPGALPGTRVVSAEQRAPDQGGLFKDTGLTRSKDTGGIGDLHLQFSAACLLVVHYYS